METLSVADVLQLILTNVNTFTFHTNVNTFMFLIKCNFISFTNVNNFDHPVLSSAKNSLKIYRTFLNYICYRFLEFCKDCMNIYGITNVFQGILRLKSLAHGKKKFSSYYNKRCWHPGCQQ